MFVHDVNHTKQVAKIQELPVGHFVALVVDILSHNKSLALPLRRYNARARPRLSDLQGDATISISKVLPCIN